MLLYGINSIVFCMIKGHLEIVCRKMCIRDRASLHPAYLARFGVTGINGIREAMKKLGFEDAADTAEGASLMISQYRALFAEQDVYKRQVSG